MPLSSFPRISAKPHQLSAFLIELEVHCVEDTLVKPGTLHFKIVLAQHDLLSKERFHFFGGAVRTWIELF